VVRLHNARFAILESNLFGDDENDVLDIVLWYFAHEDGGSS
jgi:hypothetical protein